jgi:16S rRNA (adenine1518-N6/adenine1519-N6)-dimethyltransferase
MRDTPFRLHTPRRWGQNFLVNQGAAETIILAFRPRTADLVLEVGPGRGVLTRRLSGRVSRLVAIEIDPRLCDTLRQELRQELRESPTVEIVGADVLDYDLRALLSRMGATPERRARVIANLPYSVATAVILRLLDERALLTDLLVMVQREVAERIASPPGRKTYGGLSVLCQAQARVETLLRLRPGSFRPIPKVDSELVRLTLRPPGQEAPGPGALEALLRTAFAQRRKTLLNNLARLAGPDGVPIGARAAGALILRTGLDPGSRPEDVPVEGFLALLRAREVL